MGADMAPTLNCNHEAPYIAGVCPTLRAGGNKTGGDRPPGTDVDTCDSLVVTHSLRGEGFDASKDGTGRGTPLVPTYTLAIRGRGDGRELEFREDGTANALLTPNGGRDGIGVGAVAFAIQAGALRENPNSGPDGVGVQADHAYTLEARAECQAVAFDTTQVTSKANRSNSKPGDPCHSLAAGAHAPAIAFHPTQDPISSSDGSTHAMGTGSSGGCASVAVCFSSKDYGADAGSISPTMRSMGHNQSHANGGGQLAVATSMQVRRLTPRECERLQGFPDDYTLIPLRNKKPSDVLKFAADGPRYKALGNSWAVPCAAWIGQRIEAVEAIHAARRDAA